MFFCLVFSRRNGPFSQRLVSDSAFRRASSHGDGGPREVVKVGDLAVKKSWSDQNLTSFLFFPKIFPEDLIKFS